MCFPCISVQALWHLSLQNAIQPGMMEEVIPSDMERIRRYSNFVFRVQIKLHIEESTINARIKNTNEIYDYIP